jgi:hypothetical protein
MDMRRKPRRSIGKLLATGITMAPAVAATKLRVKIWEGYLSEMRPTGMNMKTLRSLGMEARRLI